MVDQKEYSLRALNTFFLNLLFSEHTKLMKLIMKKQTTKKNKIKCN